MVELFGAFRFNCAVFLFSFIFIVFWSLDVWFLLLWPPLLDQHLGMYQVKMCDLVNLFILQNRKKRCDFLHLVFCCRSWVFVHLNLIWGWIWHFSQGIVAKFIQKSCGYYIFVSFHFGLEVRVLGSAPFGLLKCYRLKNYGKVRPRKMACWIVWVPQRGGLNWDKIFYQKNKK